MTGYRRKEEVINGFGIGLSSKGRVPVGRVGDGRGGERTLEGVVPRVIWGDGRWAKEIAFVVSRLR